MDSQLPSLWPGAAYFMERGVFYELMCPVDMPLKALACPLHRVLGWGKHANTNLVSLCVYPLNLFPSHIMHPAQMCLATSVSATGREQHYMRVYTVLEATLKNSLFCVFFVCLQVDDFMKRKIGTQPFLKLCGRLKCGIRNVTEPAPPTSNATFQPLFRKACKQSW